MYQTRTHQSLRASLLVGAASVIAFAGSAVAQTAESTAVETVVVTGSRIPQQGLVSTQPLNVVTSDEVRFQGTTNVENLINSLPQASPEFGSYESNGATGLATVSLRNLNSVRTLVLIDGRRLMPGDPQQPVADLNQIPAALVERVEVLTGGASAVYGSDALAGVVNFIMRKDFEGVEFDGTYGAAWHDNDNSLAQRILSAKGIAAPDDTVWDGQDFDGTILIGVNTADGKGNITAYAGYRNIQPILESQRDWSSCATQLVGTLDDVFCAGSSNFNRWISFDTGEDFFVLPGRQTRPRNALTDFFNFAPYNYLQRPDERYVGGAFAHYQVKPYADFYLDVMFMDDHTLAQIAPSGAFLGAGANPDGTFSINCDNPLLGPPGPGTVFNSICGPTSGLGPTDNGSLFIGRRNIEGGGRVDDIRHTSYSIATGVRGDISDHWHYDFLAQYGTTIFADIYSGDLSKQRIANALQVVDVAGVPTCKVVISGVDPACVPLDWFNGLGNANPDGLAYVTAQGFQTGDTQEQVVNLSVTGDLGDFKSPWSEQPIGLAFGSEYRRESLILNTSRDFQLNDLTGQGGATLPVPRSSFDVVEAFTEVQLPIITDQPFAKLLQVKGGYRISDYSTAGDVTSYYYAGEWAPLDDFRIRGSFQRAVRAPNVLELFTPQNNVLFGGQDPCSGNGNPAHLTLAQCLATGATAAQLGTAFGGTSPSGIIACPASQCKRLVGGNPNLSPEESDTKSFGIVLTPTFLEGFSFTADWYDITVDNTISAIPAPVTLSQCVASAGGPLCALIHRAPGSGVLFSDNSFVVATNTNIGFLKTSGYDLEANYRVNFADWEMEGIGSLGINFVGTHTEELIVEPVPGLGNYDCAGLYGLTCGTPTPKWRHKLRVTWDTPWDVSLSLAWRYVGEVKLDGNTDNPLLSLGLPPPGDVFDARIKAFNYIDLAASWAVTENVTFRAGINNMFDKDPPILDTNYFGVSSPPFGNGNTFPQVYDSLGRWVFVGATVKM